MSKYFIGIDLGTTNSAICSYDGTALTVWKSPEQNDVTPSAIFIDKRGNKRFGQRAYDAAPGSPGNAALLFKRFMGTSTMMNFSAINLKLTPEECSAEILKGLFGYLPEEIRKNPEVATVITVPAAFNQMQKNATLKAAELANLGKVSLMQEPVAAVMRVMQVEKGDSTFLIFDLGGGTFDVALAESVGGRVNLIAHGGIAMCGGRDFDRLLTNNIVKPWLREHFNLSDEMLQKYDSRLMRMVLWAAEKAKIELSANEDTVISLSETEVNVKDLDGEEIYLDVPLNREQYSGLVDSLVDDAIAATRETIEKAGMQPQDIAKIVFVGGPTNYKPLRDKVSFELAIPASIEVNPMTAVAEGASLFAESIDWNTVDHARKSNKGQLGLDGLNMQFNYIARTSDNRAKIAIKAQGVLPEGFEFQVDSVDTGWTSGKHVLKNGEIIEVGLAKMGDNIFKIFVFDPSGGVVKLENNLITICKTTASIVGIPASHTVSVVVLDKFGGSSTLDYLIKAGDALPKKGKKIYRAAESLRADSKKALTFNLVEGEIEEPVTDNRLIGCFKIEGKDFDEGIIPTGAELVFEYEMLDSGVLKATVSVPSIGSTFTSGNFYSPQEGQIDFANSSGLVKNEAETTLKRIEEIEQKVSGSEKLERARMKAESALNISNTTDEAESMNRAHNEILESKKLLAQARKENLKEIRELELEDSVAAFEEGLKKYARESEIAMFNNLTATARRCLNNLGSKEFESIHSQMIDIEAGIYYRQDWAIVDLFNRLSEHEYGYTDLNKFRELVTMGKKYRDEGNIEELRKVIGALFSIKIVSGSSTEMEIINIIRG